jgi:hypothetical protein
MIRPWQLQFPLSNLLLNQHTTDAGCCHCGEILPCGAVMSRSGRRRAPVFESLLVVAVVVAEKMKKGQG